MQRLSAQIPGATSTEDDPRARGYKKMVLNIAEKLGDESLEAIVFLKNLPKEMKKTHSPLEMLQYLERHGEFSARHTEGLVKLLQDINRNDLVPNVTGYLERTQSESHVISRSPRLPIRRGPPCYSMPSGDPTMNFDQLPTTNEEEEERQHPLPNASSSPLHDQSSHVVQSQQTRSFTSDHQPTTLDTPTTLPMQLQATDTPNTSREGLPRRLCEEMEGEGEGNSSSCVSMAAASAASSELLFQADPEEVGGGGSDGESKRKASHLQLQQGQTHKLFHSTYSAPPSPSSTTHTSSSPLILQHPSPSTSVMENTSLTSSSLNSRVATSVSSSTSEREMMSHALPGNAITTDWSESDSTDPLFDNFEPQCTWKVKREELFQRIFTHKNSPGMKLGKLDLSSCLRSWGGGGGKGGGSGARPRHAPKLVLILHPWGYDKDEGHNITVDVQVETPRDYDRTIRSVCIVLCAKVTEMSKKNKAKEPFVLRRKAEIDLGRRATMAYGFLSHEVIKLSTCNHFSLLGLVSGRNNRMGYLVVPQIMFSMQYGTVLDNGFRDDLVLCVCVCACDIVLAQ